MTHDEFEKLVEDTAVRLEHDFISWSEGDDAAETERCLS